MKKNEITWVPLSPPQPVQKKNEIMLSSLPPEIILMISKYMGLREGIDLSLSSKHFHEILGAEMTGRVHEMSAMAYAHRPGGINQYISIARASRFYFEYPQPDLTQVITQEILPARLSPEFLNLIALFLHQLIDNSPNSQVTPRFDHYLDSLSIKINWKSFSLAYAFLLVVSYYHALPLMQLVPKFLNEGGSWKADFNFSQISIFHNANNAELIKMVCWVLGSYKALVTINQNFPLEFFTRRKIRKEFHNEFETKVKALTQVDRDYQTCARQLFETYAAANHYHLIRAGLYCTLPLISPALVYFYIAGAPLLTGPHVFLLMDQMPSSPGLRPKIEQMCLGLSIALMITYFEQAMNFNSVPADESEKAAYHLFAYFLRVNSAFLLNYAGVKTYLSLKPHFPKVKETLNSALQSTQHSVTRLVNYAYRLFEREQPAPGPVIPHALSRPHVS